MFFFIFNQDEFGKNRAVDKHTKISVEIRISADIQKVKYRQIISVGLLYAAEFTIRHEY